MKKYKIAINGFGRIGRLTFKYLYSKSNIEIVVINDLTDAKTLAYLLSHDSSQKKLENFKVSYKDKYLIVNGKEILILSERNPKDLPWKDLGIDLVVESTGFFLTKEKASLHLEAGAKKVVLSAPVKEKDIKTIVYNVNHKTLTSDDKIISGASCTTNCLAPVVNAIDKAFGLKYGLMTTVHAVTNDQRILDLPHSDLRRARSAMNNIIPTTTGAAVAVGYVLPHLNGKLDGIAMRVPVVVGSVVDLTCHLNSKVSVTEINQAIKKAANETLGYCEDYIVSTDIIGTHYGSVFDSQFTKVLNLEDGGQLVKLLSWYDNESSYVSQLVRSVLHFLTI
ncbi:type I glyceraldehyde-3-phosphate dehydrogenase [Mycoplasma sp. SG1]|uniref:type I glyceraldehyde-3-phosphate dehydrogenase n=1 Tax=Mycoplasma sp. SG1 TaxID=2810348 RepID=UPI002024DAAF|nr:type I glyceraldehyde-3-phosphate dehydrogenase [Mycoplasma sp. SG1]URM52951.1 type I glyceraldehyde-3-phosphate dehydrogenase [Mycoplasma sp. SG1]